MTYYKLENAVDTEETGHVYPQTDGLIGEATFSSENSYHQFSRLDLPEKFEPRETLKFAHSSKLSDFISNGGLLTGKGYIISEKAKIVLEKLSIVNHRFYPLPVEHRGKSIANYYWFKMYDPSSFETVKWAESEFFAKRFSNNLGSVDLNSLEDYHEKRKDFHQFAFFIPSKLVSEKRAEDVFYFEFANTGIIVNQRTKDEFEENRLTGYKLTKIDHISFV